MPKMKTKKAAAKRFSKTGSGRVKRNRANKRHILTKMTTKRKRNLRGTTIMKKCDEKLVAPLIPYA